MIELVHGKGEELMNDIANLFRLVTNGATTPLSL